MELTIKNYRCFPDTDPARLALKPGFTSLIGVNNAGKSALLGFFYEFRPLFATLTNLNVVMELCRGNPSGFTPPPSVFDVPELFCNLNDRDLVIEMSDWQQPAEIPYGAPSVDRISITIQRNTASFSATLFASNNAIPNSTNYGFSVTTSTENGKPTFDFSAFISACQQLHRTLYVGAFRNILNVGTNQNYFDIVTGQAFVE